MRLRTSPQLPAERLARSRRLRREMTPAERALRAGLRRAFSGAHFRYQAPIGPYYADVVCHGARLIIEVDGSQHANAADYDAGRTEFLEARGYRVLRFWNNEVLENLDGVLTAIAAALPSPFEGTPPKKPLPPCGGEVGEGGARRSRAPA